MRQKIYYCLEQKCGIRKKGIPFRIKKFTYVLEKIVGSGASLLEARIITVSILRQAIPLNVAGQVGFDSFLT
jgi:hypothetical protein